MSDQWDGVERRATPRMPPIPNGPDAKYWEYTFAQFEIISAKLNAMHIDNVNHKAETHAMKQDIDQIKRAFPKDEEDGGPDFNGHRDHHDGLIKSSKRWADIGTDVAKKVFSGVTWLAIVFIGYAIWNEFKSRLGVPK